MDLTAFVTARLDEDEAAAKAWLPQVRLDGSGSWYDEVGESNLGPYSIEHARLHDPDRTRREVAAMRAIIAACAETLQGEESHDYVTEGGSGEEYELARFTLRQLAAVWSDHPDYRPERKP